MVWFLVTIKDSFNKSISVCLNKCTPERFYSKLNRKVRIRYLQLAALTSWIKCPRIGLSAKIICSFGLHVKPCAFRCVYCECLWVCGAYNPPICSQQPSLRWSTASHRIACCHHRRCQIKATDIKDARLVEALALT